MTGCKTYNESCISHRPKITLHSLDMQCQVKSKIANKDVKNGNI